MQNEYTNAINNRYEFVMLYDVENGNPNGDPDAGNMPRIDPETGHGIVTDVCIKRKIRNYVEMVTGDKTGFDIYVKQGAILNEQDKRGVEAVKDKEKAEKSAGFKNFMCEAFYDIRTFGAVMTTAASDKTLSNTAGQVRGPVQIAFGKSVDPIVPQEVTITRVAITQASKAETATTEMGRKHIVPYALYKQEGFISANLARTVTGFSDGDLELLWNAIIHMFDDDRSAARGKMVLRALIVFKHDNPLGVAPAHKLLERVTVKRKNDVVVPRSYGDYNVEVNETDLPDGVTVLYPYRDNK
jgi:CRISPR-associated protein Csd2